MRDGRDMAFSENQQQLKKHGEAVLGVGVGEGASSPVRSIALWSHVNTQAADFGEQQHARAATCACASRTSARSRTRPSSGIYEFFGLRGRRREAAAAEVRPPRQRSAAGRRREKDARRPARGRRVRRSSASATSSPADPCRAPILVTGRAPLGDDVGRRDAGALAADRPHPRAVQPRSHRPAVSAAPFDRFFEYVCAENEDRYVAPLERTLGFSLRPASSAPGDPLAARARSYGASTLFELHAATACAGPRPLLKDPIAVFSSEWLASRFDAQVVVLIRHPAAFASSLVAPRLDARLRQLPRPAAAHARPPGLLRGRASGDFAEHEQDVLDQTILLWRLVYSTVDTFRERHPEWTFVRHEDLARDPASGFESLFGTLEVPLDDRIRRTIAEHSSEENPAELRHSHDVRLDSRASIGSWRARLTPEQIERVRAGVADVSPKFYGDEDW